MCIRDSCIDVVKHFYQKKPILGICLGHQSIGAAFGAEIVHAKELMHGKQSLITQDGRGIFEGIPSPVSYTHLDVYKRQVLLQVMRIHGQLLPVLTCRCLLTLMLPV